MRTRAAGVALACALALGLAGCSGDDDAPAPTPEPSAAPAVPTYDGSLAPSAAVLALVPQDASTLTLTDYDDARDDLGITDLTTASPVGEQEEFWTRAEAETPLLSPGLLRPVDDRLRASYGVSQVDVAWEAHFTGADGVELGWVLGLRPGTDTAGLARAVTDGVGPLAGSTVRAEDLLVTSGTTDDGATSWAADPEMTALVGLRGVAWYVERGCVADASAPGDLLDLDRWSVQLESILATARLGVESPGEERLDAFERMRLATAAAPFAAAFAGGVADPQTGRVGFRMSDPAAAADLVEQRLLPFAACGSPA